MRAHSSVKAKLYNYILSLLGFVIILFVWDMAVRYTDAAIVMPSPWAVVEKFFVSFVHNIGKYTLWQHALFSLRRVLVGFSLAAIVGITTGILIGRSMLAESIIRPIFEMFRPIPGIAWIPMAILWFGIGDEAKYFIIFMGGLSHLVVNTYAGVIRVDYELIGVAQMLGAKKWQVFLNVVLPSCVPYVFAGLQVALSTCWMAVLAAEMVSSNEGLGFIIISGMESINTTLIFVGIISIAIIGLALATILRAIERKLCVWKVKGQ